ncbi:hypothetical protein BP00DRAFT_428173 [Aspergillus indologenus CBS 114.80]|uniref:Uncharacterized protein n=1 Tax=Aspergillus indologenus CBS 114.80 TaxID=1450541 RepID=A0A2V5I0T7_9EURO|nr:hypothetical protein BP00DRAFT_428173 [Aspergillus indologenus CBS 114.80]
MSSKPQFTRPPNHSLHLPTQFLQRGFQSAGFKLFDLQGIPASRMGYTSLATGGPSGMMLGCGSVGTVLTVDFHFVRVWKQFAMRLGFYLSQGICAMS